MLGLMQDTPLTTNWIADRAQRYFPHKEVVTRTVTGLERTTLGAVMQDARKVAGYLDSLGVSADGRVGTFAWNTARHLALYFGIPGSGRVMHTINIRYFPEQLVYTINHAEDEAVFVDRSLLAQFEKYLPELETVRHVVVMDDGADVALPDDPRVTTWAEVVDTATPADLTDRVTDERQAAAICYTTGTTGNPKGVLYSHRSTWLHSNATMSSAAFSLAQSDRVLPVVPMFHANAWGLGFAAGLAGNDLVMPGPDLSPAAIADLIESEGVTLAAGVPTIWMGVLPLLEGRELPSLRALLCGGSAVPRSLAEAYRTRVGVPIVQAWGMTETSPIATISTVRGELVGRSEDEQADIRASAGLAVPGVELRIVDSETREALPWDGEASGEIEVRGPWVVRRYYRAEDADEQFAPDGWLRTGDVATVDEFGYVRLVDRTKDLVKSGGEWISSVQLENLIMSHPKVAEAAVIAVAHPRWSERPLACVVVAPGEELSKDEVLEHLAATLSRWQLPDDVVFIDEIPKTSVGKFSKKTLRDRFESYQLPTT